MPTGVIVFRLKNNENSIRQMQQLYAYVVNESSLNIACVAVVSVSFKPGGESTKDARRYFAKRSRADSFLPLDLKETEPSETQARINSAI